MAKTAQQIAAECDQEAARLEAEAEVIRLLASVLRGGE